MIQAVTPRRRGRRRGAIVLAGAAIAVLALAPTASAADPEVTFASGTDWTVEDADAGVGPALALPGPAQLVCLNAGAPASCPSGATVFGWVGNGWGANLASIPGAAWVWAPGIDAATTPADADTYRFVRTVTVPGTPQSGTAWVAADDGAEVFVNGTSAGSASGQNTLAQLDISALLVEGANEIVVRATNSVQCGQPCTYQANPAGVVFGGTITYAAAATATPGGPAATQRPRVTNPPTSTLAAPVERVAGDAGVGAALLGSAVAALAVLGMSRRVGRRQR